MVRERRESRRGLSRCPGDAPDAFAFCVASCVCFVAHFCVAMSKICRSPMYRSLPMPAREAEEREREQEKAKEGRRQRQGQGQRQGRRRGGRGGRGGRGRQGGMEIQENTEGKGGGQNRPQKLERGRNACCYARPLVADAAMCGEGSSASGQSEEIETTCVLLRARSVQK